MSTFHDYESMGYLSPRQAEDDKVEHLLTNLRPAERGRTYTAAETREPKKASVVLDNTCHHDYESMGYLDLKTRRAALVEAFAGTAIVGWHGKIEGQLVNLLNDAEKGRNYTYADKLREFLKIWRANEITGSINRETLEILKSAADILSVDTWDMAAYFRSLKDQLRILIASEEQLPRGMEEPGNEPMAGGGGGGGGAPPMAPAFGAEEEPPGGAGGGGGPGGAGMPPGEEGAVGPDGQPIPGEEETPPGEEEAPGAEPGAPAPEEGEEEIPEPEEMPGARLGLA